MKTPETFKREGSKAGTYGWVALGTGVVLWDIFAPETLSGAVDRALEHKSARYLAVGTVALIGAHLLNLIPEEYDPLVLASELATALVQEALGNE